MLRSFRLGNHRSFRDEQELLLMPAYAKDRLALPVAAIYGANASGKSNLLDGLQFMASAVRDSFASWRPDGGVPRQPFKLDPDARNEPSVFVAELIVEGVRYTYGFEVDDERVREEWLYSYPEKRKRVLFEREGNDVKFGSTVSERGKLEVLEELLRPNSLFLSLAAQSNLMSLLPVYRWFTQNLAFRSAGDLFVEHEEVADFIRSHQTLRERLVELLRAADLGISDIVIGDLRALQAAEADEEYVTDLRHQVQMLTARRHELRARMTVENRSAILESQEYRDLIVGLERTTAELDHAHFQFARVREYIDAARRRVRLRHGELGEIFDLEDESAGTRSWLALLPIVLSMLRSGGMLIIDEIDASLHPLLAARLVGLFNAAETNAAGAQLVFTTHDTTLLHPPLADQVLDRDEVWFVEKGAAGVSTLYPLTDFKPRSEDNLERRYLAGQYGAVPALVEERFVSAIRSDVADGEA